MIMITTMYLDYLLISFIITAFVVNNLGAVHVCDRQCVADEPPMTCYYNWTLERYLSMAKSCYRCPFNLEKCYNKDCIAGDGFKRVVKVINRQLPGPVIAICQNDTVVVDLHNLAEATTIHWHGIKQFGTPYMDGVPFVTQCPILGQDSFRYVFRPREVGTYFWHSHMSFQRTDGTYGMFIIRQPPYYDANSYLYDYDLTEHAIVFADWPIRLGDEEFIEFVDSDVVLNPRSLLVNGRGKYKTFRDEFDNAFYTPRAQFNVTRGYRYRFRLCSSTNYICPVQFSIDNHSLLVIATDGNPVEPYRVDSIVLNSAERFDFVLDANQEIDSYWMRFRGFLECGSVFSTAVLYYNGSNSSEPLESTVSQSPFGTVLNAMNVQGPNFISITELNSTEPPSEALKLVPDIQFYIPVNLYPDNNPFDYNPIYYPYNSFPPRYQHLLALISGIAFQYPPSPLLSQFDDVPRNVFCNSSSIQKNCSLEFCSCVHRLKIPLDAVVELVVIDLGNVVNQPIVSHPFHIHGNDFYVVAEQDMNEGNTVEGVEALDEAGKIRRKLNNPVLKDTVAVPHGGFVILRFLAKNPGFWAFHCHVEYHLEMGMMLVFQVGELDDLPPIPENFPKCGNFYQSSKLET